MQVNTLSACLSILMRWGPWVWRGLRNLQKCSVAVLCEVVSFGLAFSAFMYQSYSSAGHQFSVGTLGGG